MSADKPIYISQERRGAVDPTSIIGITYQVITKVLVNPNYTGDAADSSHLLNLFVVNIVDADDPTQDTFDHYATLADLDLLHNSRPQAVISGATQFRDNVNILKFDNLSVAVTAAEVVRDTINNVVDTYLKVKNTFMGVSEYYFPYDIEVQTVRDQYISAYTAARDTRIAAETAQSVAQFDYENKQLALALKKASQVLMTDLAEQITSMNTLVHTVSTKYRETLNTLITEYRRVTPDDQESIDGLVSWLENTGPELSPAVDDTFLQSVRSSTATSTGYTLLALIIQAFTNVNAKNLQLVTDVTSATTAEEDALSELNSKQQLVRNAASAETEALATLATYCPNLDPGSL